MDPTDRTEVLVAIGPDQRGIAFGLLETVTESGCNIEELRMQTLGGHFAVTMRLAAEETEFSLLRERATDWGISKGYLMRLFPDRGWNDIAGHLMYKVRAYEFPDRKGLVHSIAQALMKHEVNFHSIKGDQSFSAPFTGEPLYTVDFYVQMKPERLAELREHLDELGLDCTIEREA